ncbi:MAG: hypothetical protein ABJB40_11960 [Acidobacteriota bacterium]
MKIALKIFVVGVLIMAAFFGGLGWRRLCLPRSDVEVYVNGKLQTAASAQTCPNGWIHIDIPAESSALIDPNFRGGSYADTPFYYIFGLTFSKDLDPKGISIGDHVKIDNNPDLEFSDNSIGYSDLLSHDHILIKRTR